MDIFSKLSVCNFPSNYGGCYQSHSPYWFYHSGRRRCMRTWNRCPRNPNNFRSRRQCKKVCVREVIQDFVCRQPLDEGVYCHHCRRRHRCGQRKFYYDRRTHSCRRFYYFGCGGNSNNFYSRWDCKCRCIYNRYDDFFNWLKCKFGSKRQRP
uniref:BPTI/Kunitz inhibitor domain-containing protein n=1 Tax=Octopus bimaculoides TaxID=37653 RepID=A0A0L8HVI4_OCTBM